MKTNLDISQYKSIARTAHEIWVWSSRRSNAEDYPSIKNLELLQEFIHCLDLLETVLTRIKIQAQLAEIALIDIESSVQGEGLGWDFWAIDVEESFSYSLLDLCYQLSNAWKKLHGLSEQCEQLPQISKHQPLSETFLARHKSVHFDPQRYLNVKPSVEHSILRRPYTIENGFLVKEKAKYTMPKVAKLIKDSFVEGSNYLNAFYNATAN